MENSDFNACRWSVFVYMYLTTTLIWARLEQSNKRSGTGLKTESETGERR